MIRRRPEKPTVRVATPLTAGMMEPATHDSDLALVDAYYHELAIDAGEDLRRNTAVEQAEQEVLLSELLQLSERDS